MHISEDDLLKYILEIIDDDQDRMDIELHLETCQSCQSKLKKLQRDIDIISSLRPISGNNPAQQYSRRRNTLYAVLRTAALIIFGLVAGYGMSTRTEKKPAHVTPQYLALSTPADSLSRYAALDATEISPYYYQHMLQINK